MPKISDPALLRQLNGPQPIVIGQPDATIPAKENRAERGVDIEAGRLAVSQAAEARQSATLSADVAKANADATKAQIEADRAKKEAINAPSPEFGRIQQQLQTDAVLQMLADARKQIGNGRSTGNVFGSRGFQGVPVLGQNSTDLAATLTGISGNVIKDVLAQLKASSATGASGFGALSEREGQLLQSSVAALQQNQSEPALLANLARVEEHYRNAMALINKEDPRDPKVSEKYGIVPAGDDRKPIPGANMAVTNQGNMEDDPALRGVNAKVADMVKRGREPSEIRAYLNAVRPGMGDQAGNIESAVKYARQHPDRPANINLEKVWKEASGVSSALGAAGMSAPGAGVIGAADMLSGGFLDNLTGNPDLARATMSGVQQNSPTAYLLGQIGGGAALAGGGEMALAGRGMSNVGAARVADALMGGVYGAGSADDPSQSRVVEALMGAGAGSLGGMAGRGVARAGGRALTGVQDAAQQFLHQSGVSMTPGQVLGGVAKRTEDRLAGLPIIGDQIRARRMEGVQDFNRAAFNEALAPIGVPSSGQIGQGGVLNNQQAVSQAYTDALGGTSVNIGPSEAGNITSAVDALRNIPRVGGEAADSASQFFDPAYLQGGSTLRGEDMQPILQELRGLSAGYRGDPLGYRVQQGVGGVENALTDVFNAQAPDVMPAYNAANAAYRNQSVVDSAVLKALNQGGTFMPSQLGMAARENTIKFGGRRAAARGDMPFNDLQQAGQEVLPSSVPDSGTAGRMILPMAAASLAGGGGAAVAEGDATEKAGVGATGAVIAALLASAPYSAGARSALQTIMMAERPAAFRRAGDLMINNDTIAGLLAAPIAVGGVTGR